MGKAIKKRGRGKSSLPSKDGVEGGEKKVGKGPVTYGK